MTDERIRTIQALREQGLTYEAIGQRIGLSKPRTARILAVHVSKPERKLKRVCCVCDALFQSVCANRKTCGRNCQGNLVRYGVEEARRRAQWRAERREMRGRGLIYCYGCKDWFRPKECYVRTNGQGCCRECLDKLNERRGPTTP